jgi:2-amino-4-hydroxy-6-hydroxymethyldihydropteridine diphosphokinase
VAVKHAYIGIGANLGDPEQQVRSAISALRALGIVAGVSSLYRTAPWGNPDQPDFVNAAVALDTKLAPRALLDALKEIERKLGREPGERWGPRRIDLDILAYGDLQIVEDDLVIPHPHLASRAFALVPLAEIAPQYASLRDALPPQDVDGVAVLGRA